MLKTRTLIEKLILFFVALMLAVGFVLFFTNVPLFQRYVEEDGLVEWLTVLGLLFGVLVCMRRLLAFSRKKSVWFYVVTLGLAAMLFFVAGEEISWGQRIFHIQTPAYFQEHNLQKETNFHNLLVDGVKVNMVVFTFGLIGVFAIYLLLFPLLYKRNDSFKRWIDNWGIVLPQPYQLIAFLLLFGITTLLPNEKNAELLECGAGWLFSLIVAYPVNQHIFRRNAKP